MKKYIIVLLSCCFCLVSCHSTTSSDIFGPNSDGYIAYFNANIAKELTQYRLPIPSDFTYYWKFKDSYVYKTTDGEGKIKAPYWTKGYFNDDSVVDYAYILINKDNQKKVLIAMLSDGKRYVPVILDTFDGEMGVATQRKGNYKTASGKGYWKPSKEDPSEVTVTNQAISLFEFEGASSLFIWDINKKEFRRHWISD